MTSDNCHLNAFQQNTATARRTHETVKPLRIELSQTLSRILFRWISDIQTSHTSNQLTITYMDDPSGTDTSRGPMN